MDKDLDFMVDGAESISDITPYIVNCSGCENTALDIENSNSEEILDNSGIVECFDC
jgi:hypothetical protein